MVARLGLVGLARFQRDARLLFIAVGIFSVSFFGIQMLLKVLYLLRLGYGLEYIGLFNAVGAFAYMAMALPSGALGTRFGLRSTMIAGGVVTLIGMIMLPLVEYSPAWAREPLPILSQMVLTAGYSLFAVNQIPALMALTTDENRNSAYAFNSMLRGFGGFVGTVIGGLLPGMFVLMLASDLDSPAPYRLALWLGAILFLAGFLPMFLVRQIEDVDAERDVQTRGSFPVLLVGVLVVFVLLAQAGSATCQSFCNAYMDTELGLTPAAIGLITGAGQFAAIFAPLMTPRLAARRGNGWTLMATTLGIAVFLVPLALIPTWVAAGAGRIAIVGLAALWMPALQIFQMELVDRHWRSIAYGAISTAMGLCFGTISLVGGYIAANAGYPSLFLLGMALSVAGAGVIWVFYKHTSLAAPSPGLGRA